MPGTIRGGLKASRTNKRRYGKSFYKEIGRKGGLLSKGGGFAYDREKASRAGTLGGQRSKRGMKMTRGVFGIKYEKKT